MALAAANPLVKAPNAKIAYDNKKLQEWIACSRDPLYFMENFMWIRHPDPRKGRMRFEAYGYQKQMIDCFWKFKDSIALLPRQSGKTTTAAGFLLWYAMFNPDVHVLIAANKFNAAKEIMDRVMQLPESMMHIKGHKIDCRVSAGISVYPSDSRTEQGLLSGADRAMYVSKTVKTNSYTFQNTEL